MIHLRYKLSTRALTQIFFLLLLCIGSTTSTVTAGVFFPVDSIPQRYAVNAARLCQEKNFELAKKEIELALMQPEEALDAYTWYTRGFIFKEIYKYQESENRNSTSREIAVESFLRARSLNSKHTEGNGDAALKYLATTYFKDALYFAGNFNTLIDEKGDDAFRKYLSLLTTVGSQENTDKSGNAFYKTRGQRSLQLWMADRCDKDMLNNMLSELNRAIDMDRMDCVTKYNVAIIHYNIGVNSGDNFIHCYEETERTGHLSMAKSALDTLLIQCGETREIVTALMNLNRFMKLDEEAAVYELLLKEILEKD